MLKQRLYYHLLISLMEHVLTLQWLFPMYFSLYSSSVKFWSTICESIGMTVCTKTLTHHLVDILGDVAKTSALSITQ